MSLIKWEPFGDIDKFFEEFSSLFSRRGDFAVDVYEKKNDVIVEMSLPGVDPEKIDVSVEDNHLRVVASREEEKEEKDKYYYAKEIRRGSFERVVPLPESVQKDKVKAEYENGVLKVVLPKAAKKKASKVKVKVKK